MGALPGVVPCIPPPLLGGVDGATGVGRTGDVLPPPPPPPDLGAAGVTLPDPPAGGGTGFGGFGLIALNNAVKGFVNTNAATLAAIPPTVKIKPPNPPLNTKNAAPAAANAVVISPFNSSNLLAFPSASASSILRNLVVNQPPKRNSNAFFKSNNLLLTAPFIALMGFVIAEVSLDSKIFSDLPKAVLSASRSLSRLVASS